MTGLLGAWLAEVVLVSYRAAIKPDPRRPIPGIALPSEYASVMVIYGALAFVPSSAQNVATAVGWGLVLATFLNLWQPGESVSGAESTVTPSGTATNTAPARNVDTGAAQKGA